MRIRMRTRPLCLVIVSNVLLVAMALAPSAIQAAPGARPAKGVDSKKPAKGADSKKPAKASSPSAPARGSARPSAKPPRKRRAAVRPKRPRRRAAADEMSPEELGIAKPRRRPGRKSTTKGTGRRVQKDELTFETGEFVTTGTRTRRRIKNTPVKTEVIPKARIEAKGATNLAQALDGEIGIRVDNQCSICNTTSIKLSGLPGRYTLLLVDGIPLFSSLGTTYGFVFLDAADIRQVEIVKGASSVLYGTDAISGVVNVISQRPRRAGHAQVLLEGGMFGHHKLSGFASLAKGPFSLSLVGSHSGHNSIDGDDDGISEFAGYTRTVAAATGRWRPNAKTELMLRVSGLQEKRQGGGMGHFLEVFNDYDPASGTGRRLLSESILTKRVESALKLTRRFNKGVWTETVASLVYHLQDSDYEGEYYRGTQLMVYAHQIVGWKAHRKYTLLGGLAYRFENLEENLAVAEFNYHIPGVFVQGDWHITSWLEFLHGLRYDWHNEFGHVFTPRANFKMRAHRHLTIRTGVGTGFRAPTTFYEYAHGVRPEGYTILMNADKAETAVNANLSATFSYKQWIKATAEVAYTRVTDAITVDVTDDGNLEVYNVDDPLHVVSTEVQLQSKPWKYLSAELGWGYYWYKDDAGALVSAPPVHHFTASVTIKHPGAGTQAVVSGQVFSPMNLRQVYGDAYNPRSGVRGNQFLDAATAADTDSHKREKSPWYGVINVRLEQRISRWLSVYMGVDNLLDYTQVKKESPLMFSVGAGGAPGAMDVVYIWGPMRGRFFYGGVKMKI